LSPFPMVFTSPGFRGPPTPLRSTAHLAMNTDPYLSWKPQSDPKWMTVERRTSSDDPRKQRSTSCVWMKGGRYLLSIPDPPAEPEERS
jgi:hypothetical protein